MEVHFPVHRSQLFVHFFNWMSNELIKTFNAVGEDLPQQSGRSGQAVTSRRRGRARQQVMVQGLLSKSSFSHLLGNSVNESQVNQLRQPEKLRRLLTCAGFVFMLPVFWVQTARGASLITLETVKPLCAGIMTTEHFLLNLI